MAFDCACKFDEHQRIDLCALHHMAMKLALDAERERCALIAEAGNCECGGEFCYEAQCTMNGIAKKIREG